MSKKIKVKCKRKECPNVFMTYPLKNARRYCSKNCRTKNAAYSLYHTEEQRRLFRNEHLKKWYHKNKTNPKFVKRLRASNKKFYQIRKIQLGKMNTAAYMADTKKYRLTFREWMQRFGKRR